LGYFLKYWANVFSDHLVTLVTQNKEDHFYLFRAAQGGQGKFRSDLCMSLMHAIAAGIIA
jgi:hypothetical protein